MNLPIIEKAALLNSITRLDHEIGNDVRETAKFLITNEKGGLDQRPPDPRLEALLRNDQELFLKVARRSVV